MAGSYGGGGQLGFMNSLRRTRAGTSGLPPTAQLLTTALAMPFPALELSTMPHYRYSPTRFCQLSVLATISHVVDLNFICLTLSDLKEIIKQSEKVIYNKNLPHVTLYTVPPILHTVSAFSLCSRPH